MYYDFFGFREPPFSIAPDPRYLYLSHRHKEALAHLMYGVQGQGGFIVITGEVGTGKTTISRCFMGNVPEYVDIALILNPKLSARELLSSICDELGISHPVGLSIKRLIDLINGDLLAAYGAGRHKVLIIDEAQNLSAEVLEQLRLLTNLETAEKKLLQIVLLGQPELQDMLAQPSLRQLSQRITARYHLDAIGPNELPAYLRYRLSVAGQASDIFSPGAIRKLYRLSGGVPRLINLISDRALLGAYSADQHVVQAVHIRRAAREVLGAKSPRAKKMSAIMGFASLAAALMLAVVITFSFLGRDQSNARADIEVPVGSGAIERDDTGEPSRLEDANSGARATESGSAGGPESGAAGEDSGAGDFTDRAMPLAGAFEALFGAWGRDYSVAEFPIACDYSETVGLRCMHRSGSWRALEQLNHPVILEFQDMAGDRRFITLLALENDKARIVGANGQETLAIQAIKNHWYGDYILLWRLPPFLSAAGGSGPKDDKALWLTARLMRLIALHAGESDRRETIEAMNLADQVRWYQTLKGLNPDGIAGPRTLIRMNRDLDNDSPRLKANEDQG